jgi:uncharacterized protein (TIGR02145 family)
MAENLRTTRYADGTPITHITDNGQWSGASQGAWSTPYNSTDPYVIRSQGRLYNWYAATSWRNSCPNGWHVPTDDEWNQLLAEAQAEGQQPIHGAITPPPPDPAPALDRGKRG